MIGAATIGCFSPLVFRKWSQNRSYKYLLVGPYSDYILPLAPDFHRAIQDDCALTEFKEIHSDLSWLTLGDSSQSVTVAFLRTDEAPHHVALISSHQRSPDSTMLLTNREFADFLSSLRIILEQEKGKPQGEEKQGVRQGE